MFKKIFLPIIIITTYLITCNIIYNNKITINNKNIESKKRIITDQRNNKISSNKVSNDESIGKLMINKINLNNTLYPIESANNNVDKNVTILKESIDPSINNSIVFIAAHSGSGNKAYFKNLNKLNINDEVTLIYKNKKYLYQVKDSFEQDKNGYINIVKENTKQLVLTTCSPTHKNKQLIINSILKEETN